MRLRHLVISGIKWLALARLVAQLTRWTATVLVIRELDPGDFGLAALANSVFLVVELFSSFGLGAAIVQAQEINRRMLQLIFGMLISVNFLLASIMWLIAPLAAGFYGEPELTAMIRVLALPFFLTILGSLSSSTLVREMKFRTIALAQVISGFFGAAVLLSLAYTGFGYWALVWGGIAILAMDLLVKVVARPVFVWPAFNFSESRRYIRFGSLVMGSTIALHLYVSLDVVVAGAYMSAEVVGIYAVALQLAILPLNKMMPMIRQVAFPAFSRNQSDPEKMKHYMVESMRLAMALSFPIFFGISAIAVLIVPLLLGDAWQAAALPTMLLCLTVPFRMWVELFEPALFAANRPGVVLLNSLAILCVMLPVFLIAVQWGVLGLAAGWLLVFPAIALISNHWYCAAMDISPRAMLRAIRTPIFGSALMLMVVFSMAVFLQGLLNPWLLLVTLIVVGALIYLFYLLATDRELFNQYVEIVLQK